MKTWSQVEGSPFPLGATWIEKDQAYNFSIYSKHAEAVHLLLYSTEDTTHPIFEYEFNHLKNKSGPIWHCRIDRGAASHARYYAYRVDGPAPEPGFNWHHFDFEKVLLDPYAKAVHFPEAFRREAARQPGSNAGQAPLGVLPTEQCPFDWEDDTPRRHESDLVIYELHVKGFTQHKSSGVPESHRGTFLGVIDKIPHLVELGVTAVELMPIFQFDPDEGNYWGYMPLNFFSPHHAYATNPNACQQANEFKHMVKELHRAGIEVILDVVFNHTCEGDQHGPTYSFKGVDSSTFYMMTGSVEHPFANYSGTGNTVHTANRAVRRGIVDSLRYWDSQMHVDGFRFDLASVFTRNSNGSINLEDPPIISQIGTDPDLNDNRLIAEPWDAGGEYQLGLKFPGQRWMQWNARYRDTLQQFVRGDEGFISELMLRLYGSDDLFPDDRLHAFQPSLSVNYITSHDGFTLYDLVSFREKNNWANGEENRDGANEFSNDYGWEGVENVPDEVLQIRKQQVKNCICLLLLSNGTPMFRMGDEFLQTQFGNNNPYNQDNETTWLNWDRLEENSDMFRFFREMIAFRKSHPSISRSRFWRDDVRWYGAEHLVDMSSGSRQLAFCLHGAPLGDDDLYVMINAGSEPIEFGIHEGSSGEWHRVVDTSLRSPADFSTDGAAVNATHYFVAARTIVVLVRSPKSIESTAQRFE